MSKERLEVLSLIGCQGNIIHGFIVTRTKRSKDFLDKDKKINN